MVVSKLSPTTCRCTYGSIFKYYTPHPWCQHPSVWMRAHPSSHTSAWSTGAGQSPTPFDQDLHTGFVSSWCVCWPYHRKVPQQMPHNTIWIQWVQSHQQCGGECEPRRDKLMALMDYIDRKCCNMSFGYNMHRYSTYEVCISDAPPNTCLTFHTSQLKQYIPNKADLFPEWELEQPGPVTTLSGEKEHVINRTVGERVWGRGYQYLVQWKGYEEDKEWLLRWDLEEMIALDEWLNRMV